jgi:hypothetical protein
MSSNHISLLRFIIFKFYVLNYENKNQQLTSEIALFIFHVLLPKKRNY